MLFDLRSVGATVYHRQQLSQAAVRATLSSTTFNFLKTKNKRNNNSPMRHVFLLDSFEDGADHFMERKKGDHFVALCRRKEIKRRRGLFVRPIGLDSICSITLIKVNSNVGVN